MMMLTTISSVPMTIPLRNLLRSWSVMDNAIRDEAERVRHGTDLACCDGQVHPYRT